ncbi:unnamed protein product [Calicophoron daubneyi]|uniref:Delta-like protein n=1 Tax=Calicophoron daubneyi TaxID=300641 RepID=A0AAV2TNY7_CALDB
METTCFFLIVWIMLSPIHQIFFTTVIFTATFSDTLCLDEKLPNLATFSLKVLEFQNHARRRVDGKCCGKHVETTAADICKAECSLEFRICIEPFAIPVSLTNPTPYEGPCVYGQTRTGHWGNTDMAYKPANAPTHSINITMPWPRSFSVILEAYDLVTIKEKYLIDRAIHRSLLRPIANAPPLNRASPEEWHHVTITTQLSGYTFSMRLACQPDRYNNTCTKVCMKNSSRYTCDANGDKVCEPGWSGSECDTVVLLDGKESTVTSASSIRDANMAHAMMLRSPVIVFSIGEDRFAIKDLRVPTVSFDRHAAIRAAFTPEIVLSLCTRLMESIMPAAASLVGRDNSAIRDLLDDFYCTCPVGFTGRFCEVNHECAVQPCKNNGICREITGGYRCECPDGFTGYHCEIKLSSCNPNPCQNGAYCYTLPHGFYCKCSAQHYGQFCEHERPYCGPEGCEILLDPCLVSLSVPTITDTPQTAMDTLNESQRPDLNRMLATSKVSLPYGVCGPQGTCVSTNEADGGYVCVCGSGFQGKYCHEPVNHCEEDPCLNGGTCINGLESYECLCEDGFVGEQCETPLDLCEPNPCQNGGYCQHTVHPGDFQCRCAPGWSGRWCQLRSEDPCSVSKICFNNGVCRPDSLNPGGFRCDCEPNWMGSVCQLRLPDTRACADKALCKNGATCVDVGNSFSCICRPGYDGKFCENDINECNSMPCYNNGTCRDLVNSFECDCPKGFIGTDCRININECATNPCAYGATCVDRVGDYECLCPEGRHGRHCDEVTIYTPPKPPACNFHDRIYDHGEMWVYNCQRCQCNSGQMICTDDFCGYWSCLHAMGQSDRFACKSGEVCHILSTGSEGECFVAPCYLRTVCLNATQSIPLQLKRLLPNPYPGPAIPGCRPNAAQLNNRCARIQLQFSKSRMPYGVTVGDVCTAIRELPSMVHIRNSPGQERGIGMSCDIKAIYGEETRNVIEVTLSSTDEQLRTGDDGKELSFVHKLARNVSQEMAHKAASNITVDKELRSLYETRYGVRDDTLPLPPMTMLLGTKHIDKYWHRVLLGVVEIHVDTMVVREKDLGSPILVPLVCGLILLAAALCIVFICFYAQRKHRQLILKYAPSTAANNDPSAVVGLLNKGMTNTEKKQIEKRRSDRYPNAVVPPNSGPGSGGLFSSEHLSAQSAGQTAYVGGGPGNYRSREYGQEVGTRNVGAVVV